MSKKEKVTEQNEQKVVTKYDRKMQQRKEQKEKEKKEQRMTSIIGVVIVAALVCFIASFPIRTYLATHETFVTVGGEDVGRIEFDYNYNVVKNNFMSQNGSYLSYFGLDISGDLSTQMYSDTLTWEDFFQQAAVDSLIQSKALKAQAAAAGFTYDTTEEYKEFEESVKSSAKDAGMSVSNYVKQLYGPYATLSRISECVKQDIINNAFYMQIAEEKTPAAEEIQAYYESNKDEYESVDYRVTTIQAELPTEPTELADSVEETAETSETEIYEPSEAEIEKAMADAKKLAEEAEAKVKTEGELLTNVTKSISNYRLNDWLFDSERKAGDTTIVEDTDNYQYFVMAFEKRYLDETPSVNARIILSQDKAGQEILDEWKSGEATEDSFVELCKQYSVDSTAAQGGLYEGIGKSGMPEELSAWLFDEARVAGDTTAITIEDGTYHYVMYYLGQGDPQWKQGVTNALLSDAMGAYLEEIKANITVEDTKGNLNYLKVQEAAAASEEASAEAEGTTEAENTTEAESATESESAAESSQAQ